MNILNCKYRIQQFIFISYNQIIEKPVEKHTLVQDWGADGAVVPGMQNPKVLGGTSMEYNVDAGPTKFLMGTEQGYIMLVSKRKAIETQFRFGTA